jgi:hypothetical protein
MAISSHVVEEGPGKGKGHVEHGKGKGLGHDHHADDAMADGTYTLEISGINAINHTAVDQVSPPTTVADGTQMNTEVRAGSITIDRTAGDDGDGALHLVTDSNNGRLRVNDVFDADNQFRLGDLDHLSFDYKVASSDRTDVIPVIRIAVDGDGNLATTADRGELVFEYAYQGFGAVTPGTWQHVDLAGSDWNAWQRSNGANHDAYPDIRPLSDWQDASGYTAAGGVHFDQNSLVLGWSIALGSGNGTNSAFLDHLQVGGVTYDFMV